MIVGKVTDPSGAVIPGAYQITAEQPGFKTYVRDVEVQVNSRV